MTSPAFLGSRDAVLVTGASTGIGRACAEALAARGLRVFAGVRREGDGDALRSLHAAIEPVMLDVTDALQVEAAAKHVASEVGDRGLLGVVANAGIALAAPLEFVDLDQLRRQLEVNVVGVVATVQSVLPSIRRRRGRVVVIGSSSGYFATPLMGPYTASKFAVEGLCDAWRMELRHLGVEVCLVEPGAIATPIWDKGNREADAALAKLPTEGRSLYGPLIEAIRRGAARQQRAASPVSVVARDVAHALTAPRPRTRYRPGSGARLQWVLSRLLPDRIRDVVVTRFLGVTGL
jgi:NAD(P)-dependent dehydrogenase (short-subunit alcohol dehydrogenase family)